MGNMESTGHVNKQSNSKTSNENNTNNTSNPELKKPNKKDNKEKLSKYPEVILNTNVIIPILLYLNDKEILMDACILNKKISERLNSRIIKKKKNYFSNKFLPGKSDMNEVYCQFDMIDYFVENCNPEIKISVDTKDQGWASVNVSSSWVELRFKNKITENQVSYDIGRNFKERDFKELKLNLNEKCSERNLNIYNHFKDINNIVQIVARSIYPGWVCYIRRAEFDFKYFYIKRQ